MIKRIAIILLLASRSAMAVTAGGDDRTAPKLDVNQILEKNLAARGGLDAWRKVQTMMWIGHLQSGNSPEIVPFMMQMKRPDKMRFEITVDNEKSIRAFDGREGWKVRPPRTGKPELAPFTSDEVRFAHDAPGLDGPLIDHEAKGIGVELDGTEEVDGRKAYRLTVKLPSGTVRHVWIDATTFLEIRYDRETRSAAGIAGIVLVNYRNYRAVEGLQIPMTIDTGSANGPPGDRILIDRVLVNPPLEDSAFARPGGSGRRSHAFGPGDILPGRSGVPPSGVPPALGRTARPGSSAVSGASQPAPAQPGSPAQAQGAQAGAAASSEGSAQAPQPAPAAAPPESGTAPK